MFTQVKARMTIYFSIVVFVLMAGFSGFLYWGFQWLLYRNLDRELLVLADAIEDSYDPVKNEFTFLKSGTENLKTAREGWVRIIAENGEIIFRSDGFLQDVIDFPLALAKSIKPEGQLFRNFNREDGQWFHSIILPVRNVGANYSGGWVEVSQPLKPLQNTLAQFRKLVLISLPLVLLVVGWLSYYVVNRFIRPVALMADQTEQITFHNLKARLPVVNPDDEFGRLAQRFNNLLDRLEHSFLQQQQLLSDISHELKTPVTVLRLRWENQIADGHFNDETRAQLAADVEELTRLSQMVSDLGLLSQSLENAPKQKMPPLDLAALLQSICGDMQLLAEEKNQEFRWSLGDDICVAGESRLLRRLFINLLDNAIKFTPEGGTIDVFGKVAGHSAIIEISDSGIGMTTGEIERVFDRFYRGETARSEHVKGSGLGLTLAKWIASIHNGRLELHSEPGNGSRATVFLPIQLS